jgi:hypothetical protein
MPVITLVVATSSRRARGSAKLNQPVSPTQESAACAIPESAKAHTMKITTPNPATTSLAQTIFFSL